MWFNDPKTKEPSVTVTMMVTLLPPTFFTGLLKLLLSGNTVAGIQWGEFTGGDFGLMVGAATGALGGIYGWRKHQESNGKNKESEKDR